MEQGDGNIERLRDAGFEIKTPLPQQYADVIEGLAEDELTLLISIKTRFDEAQAETPPEVGSYAAYILGPMF
jgi:hypothetical protein